MNTTATYTPLESLLLFQSLVAFGTRDEDFFRISDLLTNNALVKDEKTYDARRLTVDALRDLYLRLLRDELRADDQDGDGTLSKKRKIQSPPLPSFQDAQDYGDKLPLVVDRLYARYRDYMIKTIQDEERRYAELEREILEIERGEWDDRIAKDQRFVTNGISSAETVGLKSNGTNSGQPRQDIITKSPGPHAEASLLQPSSSTPRPEGYAINDVLNNQEQTSAPRPPDRPRTGSQGGVGPHMRTGSVGPHGPSPLQPGHHPIHAPPPQHQSFGWAPPYQPGQQVNHSQYGQFQPPLYQHQQSPSRGPSPLLPPPYPPVPSSPISNHPHQYAQSPVLSQAQNRASPSSPAPPYPPPVDPGQHGQAHLGQTQLSQPQHPQSPHPPPYRGSSGSPLIPQGQLGFPPHFVPRPASAAGGQFQTWQQGPMQPHSPQYPPSYPQSYGPPPPHQSFQSNQPAQPVLQPPSKYNSPYHPGKHQQPQGTLRSQISNPSTPKNRPASVITGFGTKWTPTPTGRTPGPYERVERPAMEPVSPIPPPTQLLDTSQSAMDSVGQSQEAGVSRSKASKRGQQHVRAGSTASSVVARTRRSQSVMSQADELSLDEAVIHQVKEEEVNTPRGVEDLGDTTADESSMQPQLQVHRSRPSFKRKRGVSNVEPRTAGPASHVLWTRAFPKISAAALEAVTHHKSGGTFAVPVKEKDAPGYKESILRPQDLKSIRSAIIAGNRAATAAAPADLNPSATSVWLPVSDDLIPPKAIINYSQFERELMRMFANAIMFNPDPDRGLGKRWRVMNQDQADAPGYAFDEDSVVKETKAMFTDVEGIIADLRAAERRSEDIKEKDRDSSMATKEGDDDDIDELAGDGDHSSSAMGSVAKRKRKA